MRKKTVRDITKELTDRFFYERLARWNMMPHKEVAELLRLKTKLIPHSKK